MNLCPSLDNVEDDGRVSKIKIQPEYFLGYTEYID